MMNAHDTVSIVPSADPANHNTACPLIPKWAATVNDKLVLLPQHVTAGLIKQEAGISADLVLIRDLGSPNDIPFEDDTKLDLARGNVFYTLPRCEVKDSNGCDTQPKLVFVIDDRPEE